MYYQYFTLRCTCGYEDAGVVYCNHNELPDLFKIKSDEHKARESSGLMVHDMKNKLIWSTIVKLSEENNKYIFEELLHPPDVSYSYIFKCSCGFQLPDTCAGYLYNRIKNLQIDMNSGKYRVPALLKHASGKIHDFELIVTKKYNQAFRRNELLHLIRQNRREAQLKLKNNDHNHFIQQSYIVLIICSCGARYCHSFYDYFEPYMEKFRKNIYNHSNHGIEHKIIYSFPENQLSSDLFSEMIKQICIEHNCVIYDNAAQGSSSANKTVVDDIEFTESDTSIEVIISGVGVQISNSASSTINTNNVAKGMDIIPEDPLDDSSDKEDEKSDDDYDVNYENVKKPRKHEYTFVCSCGYSSEHTMTGTIANRIHYLNYILITDRKKAINFKCLRHILENNQVRHKFDIRRKKNNESKYEIYDTMYLLILSCECGLKICYVTDKNIKTNISALNYRIKLDKSHILREHMGKSIHTFTYEIIKQYEILSLSGLIAIRRQYAQDHDMPEYGHGITRNKFREYYAKWIKSNPAIMIEASAPIQAAPIQEVPMPVQEAPAPIQIVPAPVQEVVIEQTEPLYQETIFMDYF